MRRLTNLALTCRFIKSPRLFKNLFLIINFPSRACTLHAREAVEILQENFGTLVYDTRIRKTVRYAEAPVKGTSVLKYDSNGNAARAYRDLAGEVLRNGKAP